MTTDAERGLMTTIRSSYGELIEHVRGAVPAEFIAALIANESGGNAAAQRFERDTLLGFWNVVMNRKDAFQGIARDKILQFVTGAPTDSLQERLWRLDTLATSWGLTQIMGYHYLSELRWNGGITALLVPETSLAVTVTAVQAFAHAFRLDVANDFVKLFHCWNAGSPNGTLFDPNYASLGVMRLQLYRELPA